MPTSRKRRPNSTFTDYAVSLCWGAWVELGVSGWARTHEDWAIDPESLIIFTAALHDTEPRRRDEALDWCVHYWRHVSRVRLRNLRDKDADSESRAAWGEFAATVNARAGSDWSAGTEERRSYRVTGRSTLRSLDEPSLIYLRMRSMFGVGARAEILRHLLLSPGEWVTAAQLARAAGYTKRNVAEECESLERAGVLAMKTDSNRFTYSLARRRALEDFVGDVPSIRPTWKSLFNVLKAAMDLEEAEESLSHDALVVEAHRVVRDIEDDLEELGIEGPRRIRGTAFWDEFQDWASATIGAIAAGQWPAEEDDEAPVRAIHRSRVRRVAKERAPREKSRTAPGRA
jgi:hypothetical protein